MSALGGGEGGAGKGKGTQTPPADHCSHTPGPQTDPGACLCVWPSPLLPYTEDVTALHDEGAKTKMLYLLFNFQSAIVLTAHSGPPFGYTDYLSGWTGPPIPSGHAPSNTQQHTAGLEGLFSNLVQHFHEERFPSQVPEGSVQLIFSTSFTFEYIVSQMTRSQSHHLLPIPQVQLMTRG